jgi:EAL domain-containing protein (putative c-di-GMP-specific phosphodiesterase class I)/GGDEF domain-containing protein
MRGPYRLRSDGDGGACGDADGRDEGPISLSAEVEPPLAPSRRSSSSPAVGLPRRQAALLRYAGDGLVLLDEAGEAVEVAPSYTRVLGRAPAERQRMRTAELVHPDDLQAWRRAWAELMGCPGGAATVVLRARHADGGWRKTEVTFVNGLADPAAKGVVATIRGLGEAPCDPKAVRCEQPPPTAPLDAPGGREAVVADLGDTLGGLRAGAQVVVAAIRLDQLHLVARACGHGPAGGLVEAAAARLRRGLRAGDDLGFLDHDRLVVVCETHGGKKAATSLARRLSRSLSEPFRVEEDQVVLTASIGIALTADPATPPEALLDDAEVAMGVATAAGGNRWSFYCPAERAEALNAVTLPAALRRGLAEEQFVLHYQPVVEMGTGRVVGAEALVRWRRGGEALVGPDSFIATAESSGVISALGTWVLRAACHSAARWPAGAGAQAPYVAVNLSAHQLEDPRLTSLVRKTLAESGLAARRLVVEVTESVLMADPEIASRRLGELRHIGVRVAMDDFGTGYSSLAHLKALPLDILKIDRSFVAGLGAERADAAIVEAVVTLARALGLDAIAEGVETPAQADELRNLGCPHAQGYFFGRPGPSSQIDE